jgi:hypothetical protein
MGHQIADDFMGVAEGIAHDVAKLGHSLKDVRVWSPYITSAAKDCPDAQQASSNTESHEAASSRKHVSFNTEKPDFGSDGGKAMPSSAVKSPSEYSEISSSVTSTSDTFPHACQSLELVAKESSPQRLSTTVSMNFSLPGYKPKRASNKEYFTSHQPKQDDPNKSALQVDTSSSARPSVRFSPPATSPTDATPKVMVCTKQSDASLASKSKSPSLLSGGSRSSARHALLKPSVPDSQHVDVGLPIPPVLSPIASISAQAMPEMPAYHEKLKAALVKKSKEAQPVDTNLPVPSATVDNIREQVISEKSSRREILKTALVAEPTKDQPVDTSLPIGPVLSQSTTSSGQEVPKKSARRETLKIALNSEPSSKAEEEMKPAANFSGSNSQSQSGQAKEPSGSKRWSVAVSEVPVGIVSTVAGHVTTVQNAEDLVKSVQSRVEGARTEIQKPVSSPSRSQSLHPLAKGQAVSAQSKTPRQQTTPNEVAGTQQPVSSPLSLQSPPPALVKAKAAMGAPQVIAKSPRPEAPHQHKSQTEAKHPASAEQALSTSLIVGSNVYASPEPLSAVSRPSSDALNAAYWGFVPVVKEAVQGAVQTAVRNAVHEIVMPAGVEKDEASDAYRKLVANTLVEAAKDADNYLRRASLWNEPSLSARASESTVICLRRSLAGVQTDDPAPAVGDPCADTPRRTSVASKENDGGKAVDPSKETTKPVLNDPIGDVPANFKSYDKVAGSGDDMEAVPLEPCDKPLSKSKKRWPKPWRNGRPFGHDAIPTRKSSRNRVLSLKTPGTNAASNSGRTSHKRSFERLISRVSPVLRSVSSEGSLKQDKDGEKPLLPTKELDRRNDRSSASQVPSEEIFGRKNTVQWLKNLLSNNGPYEPRFTALPPRIWRDYAASGARLRSQTAPVAPAAEFFLGASPKPAEEDQPFVKDRLSIIKGDERASPSETFTRTINNLENLMNEALIIARQAADNQDAGYVPAVLGDAAKVLKIGRDRYMTRLSGTRYSNNDSAAPSIHESLRDLSDSDVSYHSDELDMYEEYTEVANGEVGRAVTVSLNSPAKHPSGWPPTGRVTTPYPPASMPPSTDSQSPPAEGVEQAVATDPHHSPTETELEELRKLSPPKLIEPDAANNEDDFWDKPKPEFRFLEPFGDPKSRDATRKSSSKSPKRLSPNRQTQSGSAPVIPQDLVPLPKLTPRNTDLSRRCVQDAHEEEEYQMVKSKLASKSVLSKQEVREYIIANQNPPIQPRSSSRDLRKQAEKAQGRNLISSQTAQTGQIGQTGQTYAGQNTDLENMPPVEAVNGANSPPDLEPQPVVIDQPGYAHSFDGSQVTHSEEVDFNTGYGARHRGGGETSHNGAQQGVELRDNPDPNLPQTSRTRKRHVFSLRGKNHVSLNEHHHKGFSLARSQKRQSIARDWSPGRKRFVASVACFSTALIGILVGIYAGETPAIQYYIVDFHHYTVLGNAFFFIGLAIPTFFFWPLPLLHGRKPYILGSMSLAMPLLFPQALAVGQFRSPYMDTWRVGLILPRALMGFCLGFANINFKSMLTDLFGASLQSTNPHQEHVDKFDVRRHGGGMGVWLGLWTWSALGSIGLGFLIGAVIINNLPPAWGFYISITIIAFIMLLNVLCPEVRRSAFRRSVAEAVNGQEVSRRLARGEVKMHMVQSGPKWWGEEFHYGVLLSISMLRQPGFLVMALYVAWIYGQMVLNILVSFPGSWGSVYADLTAPWCFDVQGL